MQKETPKMSGLDQNQASLEIQPMTLQIQAQPKSLSAMVLVHTISVKRTPLPKTSLPKLMLWLQMTRQEKKLL
jgi:hypothetical protein